MVRPRRFTIGTHSAEITEPMSALAITIFVSLTLAVFFVALFLIQTREGAGNPADALLPLRDDSLPPADTATRKTIHHEQR